jgi:probable rRNA maturation factor
MRALNKKYLKHDYATDVLAFDLGDGFAEIIICPRAALANARRYKTTTDMEIMTYTIHGILHLAGHDDHEPGGMLRMRRVENELMRKISPV